MNEERTYGPMEELILRYLSGNAEDAEINELEKWVSADPVHRTEYIEMRKAWMLGGMSDNRHIVDVDKAWHQVSSMTAPTTVARTIRMQNNRKLFRIAAAGLFMIVATALLYRQLRPYDDKFVASNSSKEVHLTDGSTVTMNHNSELKWTADKDGKRVVSLMGDAYFDVAKDAQKPFVITSGDIEVEVLGTSFYVDGRADVPTLDVTVASGRVAVRYDATEVILEPDEKAVFNKTTHSLEKQQNTDRNFTSVKTKTLIFESSKLDEVAQALNRQYHTHIIVEPSVLKTCELTSTFENKSLEAILQIMASTMNIEIVHQNQDILLRGSCTLN